METYQVDFIEEKTDEKGDLCGGDGYGLKEFKSKKAALKYGLKKSYQKTFKCGKDRVKIHEVYIRYYDEENDNNYVWFMKNGKITHHDVG